MNDFNVYASTGDPSEGWSAEGARAAHTADARRGNGTNGTCLSVRAALGRLGALSDFL